MRQGSLHALVVLINFIFVQNLLGQEVILGLPTGHGDIVYEAHFSPDGKLILTTSYDNTVRLWDVKSGKLIHTYEGRNVGFDSNSKIIAIDSSYYSETNTNSDKRLEDLPDLFKNHEEGKVIITPNGDRVILVYSFDRFSELYDIDTGEQLSYFLGSEIQFSPNGKLVVTTSNDNAARLYNVESGKLLHSLEGKVDLINSFQLNNEGTHIATVENERGGIWDLKTGKLIHELNHDLVNIDNTLRLNYTPNDKYIVIASDDGLKLFDSNSGKLLYELIDYGFGDFRFDSDNNIVSRDRILEINSRTLFPVLENYYNNINSVTYSNNRQYKLTVNSGESVKLYDAVTGNYLYTLQGNKDPDAPVNIAQFSPDDNFILGGDRYFGSYLWNAKTGKVKYFFDGYKAQLSSDGKFIMTDLSDDTELFGGKEKTIKVWDAQTGDCIYTMKGYFADSQFFPNNKYFITSYVDGSIIIWDIKTGKQLVRQLIFNGKQPLWLLSNGYYMASKEAASKLYYIKGLQTIGFEQLDVKYNRPDKVLEVLGKITDSDNSKMINAYKKAWVKRIRKLDIDTTSFRQGFSIPESDIMNRDDIVYEQKQSVLELQIKGMDSTYLLDRYNIWVNEVPIFGRNGISLRSKKTHLIEKAITVKLSKGENKIETSVLNVNGIESYRQPLYVNYTPKDDTKDKLYFVGIGVDKYREEGHNLNYSVKDIKDLSLQLKEKYGDQIEIDTLFNQNVTISNIKNLKENLQKTTVDDKVIISFSGHGLLSKDLDYYLATYDVNFSSPAQNGLPYDDLEYLLDGIPSRQKLLLIDACHSGEVDKEDVESIKEVENLKEGLKGSIVVKSQKPKMGMKNSFELMKELFNNVDRATGTTVISAAAGTQFAQEGGGIKNGVFTYCILNQLKEKETISVSELKQLVSEQVQEITSGLQQPTSRNETIENDWRVW